MGETWEASVYYAINIKCFYLYHNFTQIAYHTIHLEREKKHVTFSLMLGVFWEN